MKFLATLALLAGASTAIKIEDSYYQAVNKKICIPLSESDEIFNKIDKNHNHKIGPPELYGAIKHWA